MANPLSWLATAGKAILKVLGVATQIAVVAAPEVSLLAPEVAGIYSSTVGLAVAAEAALGSGTGAQKLAAVTASVMQYAQQNGWTAAESDVQKWASAVADTLNLMPFKAATQPATPTA